MWYDFGLNIAQSTQDGVKKLAKNVDDLVRDFVNLKQAATASEKAVDKAVNAGNSTKTPTMPSLGGDGSEGGGSGRSNSRFKNFLLRSKKFKGALDDKSRGLLDMLKNSKVATKGMGKLTKVMKVGHKVLGGVAKAGAAVGATLGVALVAIAALALGAAAAVLPILMLKGSMEESEKQADSLKVSFGGLTNTLNAMQFSFDKIASGQAGTSSMSNIMEGMGNLQKKGVDAKKYFQTISDMAGATGHTFAETSAAISSAIEGNTGALEDWGIQEPYMRFLSMYKANSPQMRAAVLSFVEQQKQFSGGAAEAAMSFEGSKNRIKSVFQEFKQSIMGRLDDENSLISRVRATMSKVADWFDRHRAKMIDIARGIGIVLKWVWTQAEGFARRVANAISRIMDKLSDGNRSFTERMRSMVLWLEVVKTLIVRKLKAAYEAYKDFSEKWAAIDKKIGDFMFKLGKNIRNAITRPIYELSFQLQTMWDILVKLSKWDLDGAKQSFALLGLDAMKARNQGGSGRATGSNDPSKGVMPTVMDSAAKNRSGLSIKDDYIQWAGRAFKDDRNSNIDIHDQLERAVKNDIHIEVNYSSDVDPEEMAARLAKEIDRKLLEKSRRGGN